MPIVKTFMKYTGEIGGRRYIAEIYKFSIFIQLAEYMRGRFIFGGGLLLVLHEKRNKLENCF